ncbi:DUF3099 domain-containing protein [Pseudokineococcus sp. 1T1Z-3]|uniref:DUF3099 domain-containing protein n=1 Tax=Pseudokineococcus sp. 1T1Z-3 TaxID=3132745 RepID=UPI0030AC8A97
MASTSADGARSTGTSSPRQRGSASSSGGRRQHEEVQRITTAPVGQRQHQQQRIGRYMVSMGIRTACFVLALVVASFSIWAMWVCLVLAIVLPYFAVLAANAGRETVRATTTQVTPVAQPALAAPTSEEPLVGEVREPGAPSQARQDGEPWRGAA